jgi:hypothetical protein
VDRARPYLAISHPISPKVRRFDSTHRHLKHARTNAFVES